MLPPGPTRSPLANLQRFARDPYGVFWDAAAEFGPVFGVQIAGQPAWVSVGEPASIEQIFRGGSDEFLAATDVTLPGALALLDDERSPTFRGERIAGHARSIAACVDAVVERLRPGQRVRASALMASITARATVECVIGIHDPTRRDRLLALLEAEAEHLRAPAWPLATLLAGGAERLGPLSHFAFTRTRRALRALIAAEIQQRHRDPSGRDDLLALLIEHRDERGLGSSDAELLDRAMAILIDAHDGSALSLAWALWLLSGHRAHRERVLDEAREPGQGSRMIEAVIDETLRMRPVAHHTARRLARPLELGEWSLPAGTYTLASQAVTHFRADLWDSPFEFRPERFSSATRPSPFVYFPFAGGARIGLGRSFALLQMRVILQRLLQRLELRVAVDADPRPAPCGLLIGPSDGVPIVIETIHSALAPT
ncbi:cytochrome P450 [Nannocystaceae bacterium ST9]